jgi:hypothetical protein
MENKNIYKAIAAFQQEVPTIHKATKAFKYSYANLPDVLDVINPLMQKHGLGFTQLIRDENLVTIIFHVESGENIESSVLINSKVQLPSQNEFQVMGSAITYLRRYSLSAMLGLVTDVDTDANGSKPATPAAPTVEMKDGKPVFSPTHTRWTPAKGAIKAGKTTIEELSAHYYISEENKKLLKTYDNESI